MLGTQIEIRVPNRWVCDTQYTNFLSMKFINNLNRVYICYKN
jgi:hypothetical protein